jgi:predicted transcriptional regulator
MAVAFPFDQLTSKPGAAMNKLQTALNKIIEKLNQKVAEITGKAGALSKTILCDDPRVKELKQILQQIQSYITQIQNILRILNIIVPILAAAAQIAAVLINGQLANPVPSPPAVSQTLAVQNELVANIAKALTQASIIITITNGAVSIASQLIGPVINLLSSICNNETFNVNQDTKNALNADTELSVVDTDSEFYQLINVTQTDIDLREDLITQLQEQQRSLLTDLLEAPSRVIIGTGIQPPDSDRGKAGDYFINQTTKTIYGPKISDTEWPTGINY